MTNLQEEILKRSETKPIFADEVIVVTPMKAVKRGKRTRKEGHVVLFFIDMLMKRAIAQIVLSPSTAYSLKEVLDKVLSNYERELKRKTKSRKKVSESGTQHKTKYIQ